MSGFGTFGAMFGAGGGQVVAAGGGGGIRGQWGGSNNSGVSVMHHVDLTAVAHDRNETVLDELKESLAKERASLAKLSKALENEKKKHRDLQEKMAAVNTELALQGKRMNIVQENLDEFRASRDKIIKETSACKERRSDMRVEFQKKLATFEKALRSVHKENSPEVLDKRLQEAQARLERQRPWVEREKELGNRKVEMQLLFEQRVEQERRAKRMLLCAQMVQAMEANGTLSDSGRTLGIAVGAAAPGAAAAPTSSAAAQKRQAPPPPPLEQQAQRATGTSSGHDSSSHGADEHLATAEGAPAGAAAAAADNQEGGVSPVAPMDIDNAAGGVLDGSQELLVPTPAP